MSRVSTVKWFWYQEDCGDGRRAVVHAVRLSSGLGPVGAVLASLLLGAGTFVLAQVPDPQVPAVSAVCTVTGQVASGGTALPGVSLRATRDGMVVAATSTDVNGGYSLRLPPGTFQMSAELAAFARFEQEVTVSSGSCPSAIDVALVLGSRAPDAQPAAVVAAAPTTPSPEQPAPPLFGGRGRGRRGGGAGAVAALARTRFAQLDVVQSDTAGAAADDAGIEIDFDDPAARLLPPGFSTSGDTDVVAVLGDAARIDRGQLRDRLGALGRGEFEAFGGQLPPGIDLNQAIERFAGGGFGGPGGDLGGPGGRGGVGGAGGRGGRGGDGGGFLGRGRAGNAYSGSANYTFGGSVLDASPARIRASSQVDPDYVRQNFGVSVGGPLRLPGVSEARRPNIFFNYSGGRSTDLFDRYATVPTLEMRSGDLSSLGVSPIDPQTGLPFANGQIPDDRIDPGSRQLLGYIPEPNLPGTTQNYRRSATSATVSDNYSLRFTQTLGAAGRGRGGRGGRGGGGRGGRAGGAAGFSATINTQVQYQRSDSDALNVFSDLDGANNRSSLSVPVTVNMLRNRTIQNVQLNFSRTSSAARNAFADVVDVAGAAGIGGVSTDAADWGVPTLSFSTFTGLRDLTPTRRSDNRFSVSYSMTRPAQRHNIQWGGDARFDTSRGRSNGDARGTFVFTGLYSSGGAVGGQGLDFADFLLGAPQQATVQYADDVVLQGRSFSLYAQDDWRFRGNLTLNLGVRYELVRPFTEASGRMVNLDVASDYSGAAPVQSGGTGAYSGLFPNALVNDDYNNVAPRVGLAWRTAGMVVRTGFGTSFNNGSYSSIARQLTAQPPFAVTNTSIGTQFAPLSYDDPFATIEESTTTNNFGVDKGYQLGVINTWNVDVDRGLPGGWQIGGGYTGTQGIHLDLVRAPNRGPDGLRIEGVQPFLWQTSEGRSILHSATIRLRRRQSAGVSGTVSYTIAKSMDDASSIGGGGQQVAQDDQNLAAEWGLSSFDRRHQFNGSLTFELPFGENRPWLYQGGVLAALLSNWSIAAQYSAQSGTPLTARVVGASSDVARGTNGSLRADYTGAPISIDDPTLLQYFNTTAFAVPLSGTFGSAGRNTIIGPAQQQLDATLSRDLRLGTQGLSIQVRASNVLNSVYFGAIDTTVNSPTFGQVTSFRPRRSVQLNLRFRF